MLREARFESRLSFAGSSMLETSFGYRGVSFGHSNYGHASVDDAISAGRIAAPPGFRDGFRAPIAHTRLVLDSRPKSASEGSLMPTASYTGSATGVRLEALADQGVDLENEPGSGWLRYGGTAGGFVGHGGTSPERWAGVGSG